MVTNNKTTERGAVALITAMIVSILLMITTAGMVSLTVKSLRQSTDGAQSTKAYYAAEGGLEEALLKLQTDPNYQGNCQNGAAAGASAQDGAVTCVTVKTNANELVDYLPANSTVQLDISAVAGLQSLKVEWGLPGSQQYVASTVPVYLNNNGGSNFPAGAAWPIQTAPAILELGVVQYPSNSAAFSIDQVKYFQGTLGPQSSKVGAAGPSNAAFGNAYTYNEPTALNKPFVAACSTANAPYVCSAGVGGLGDGNRFVLRLKSRYNDAQYRITAQGAGNVALPIPGAVYTIDVTARAGDVFRRIQTSFPIGDNPTGLPGLDYVLYSDTDICKSFQVKGGGAVDLDIGAGLSCRPL